MAAKQEDDLMLFFNNALKKMYWAEKNIERLLDQMHVEAFSINLKNTIEIHQLQTRRHIQRLEQVFKERELKPEGRFCEALKGLLNDAMVGFSDTVRKTRIRDVAISTCLLKITHYEMATYTMLIHMAQAIGWHAIVDLLHQNLAEEKEIVTELDRRPY
ncbi:YciE/YciF ferroxidase family protein [Paraflavitalea soli]|nr:DUF892 family protein [Paraflavitalea soli]